MSGELIHAQKKYYLIFMLFVFSTMMILKFKIFSLFWILEIFMFIFICLKNQKLVISSEKWIITIFLELVCCVFFAMFGDMWVSYKKAALVSVVLLLPLFFTYSYIEQIARRDKNIFLLIKKGIKISCLIELIWCISQFFFYKSGGIDINNIIFVKLLHLTENATHFKDGVFMPSGLCWHAAFITPVAIISFLLFDSYIVKMLAIFDAVICNNATAMIGIGICIGCTVLNFCVDLIRRKKIKFSNKVFIAIIAGMIIVIPVLIHFNAFQILWEKIIHIYHRATGGVYDGSANAHIMYYTSYPEVVSKSSIIQVIFGYGSGCSGYPISKIFGQYSNLKSWSTESDIMNILLSRGILGFVIFYGFLGKIAVKGAKKDSRYIIIIVSLIMSGITYNIQFDWVILIEMILWLSIKCDINFFEVKNKDKKFKRAFKIKI